MWSESIRRLLRFASGGGGCGRGRGGRSARTYRDFVARPGWPAAGAIVLLAAAVILLLFTGEEGDRELGEDRMGGGTGPRSVTARVLDVTDGDTIKVALGGEEESVRYIGIDTPEHGSPYAEDECFGGEASEANQRLVGGREVRLVFDAERRDRYGRLLAYVHVGSRFVNGELLRQGYARTLTIEPNTDRAGLLDRLEQRAGNAGRGLWAACGP